jgi:PLP dependent protein
MSIAENIEAIRERIANAAIGCGRDPGSVRLMAVSKFNPASSVMEAYDAGQCLFGENRVPEAVEKFTPLFPDRNGLELHLIGSLQRNKVSKIVKIASCIQSVDRLELLEEIGTCALKEKKAINILFEIHTGEESKSGYADRDSLFRSIDSLESLPFVACRGFMTMAPFTDDTDAIRSSFRKVASLQRECQSRYPSLCFSVLSMGMSSDFTIAIEEGSTLVRVGTAIFGNRQ